MYEIGWAFPAGGLSVSVHVRHGHIGVGSISVRRVPSYSDFSIYSRTRIFWNPRRRERPKTVG